MKKILILIAIAMLSLSGASALEPLKVAIMNTSSSAVNVQVILNDYTGGSATTKYTGAIQSLTPNGSGIIIAQVANNVGTDWDDITGAEVSSYYILDVLVGGNLYAQYRLDQLILSQSQSTIYNNNGNLAPSTSGANGLGEDNNRWGELFLTGNTLHIGPDGGMAGADELAFSYNDATNTATMTVAGFTALTAVNDNINIPQQVTIDGLEIGQGGGNIATNTAIGNGALIANTSGGNNTATGNWALFNNTTGSNNTATGQYALTSNTTGSNNTATGQYALTSNTTGSNNAAFGNRALLSNTTGNGNTANGRSALYNNTTGNGNTANGLVALYNNTTGSENSANGSFALYSNTTGNGNTANGAYSLYSNTTGNGNTANGAYSLYSNTSGSINTANGTYSLYSNTSGSNNIANGQSALYSNTTGSDNTAIGRRAGYSLATGFGNTFIGKEAGSNVSQKVDAQNSMAIGADTYTTADNQVVIGNSAITQTQLRGATLVDLAGGGTQNLQVDNNGKIVVGGGSGAFTSASGVTKGNTLSDDLLFGANTLNYGSGTESKLFFDNGNRAFRVGLISTTNWDLASLGNASIGAGNNTKASGDYSVSMGYYTEATAEASVALGRFAKANGDYSVAIGNGGVADGTASVALGFNSNSNGDYSTTMGRETTADGDNSVAMGRETKATAVSSVAMGYGTQSIAQYGLAAGKFNDPVSSHLFVVGNGTGVGTESNAFAVLNSGNVEIGDDATASHTVKGTMYINDVLNANGSTGSVAVHFSATAPSSPVTGSLWYDSTNSLLKIWDGSAWVNI